VPDPGAWFTVRTLARCYKEGRKQSLVSLQNAWRWVLGGGLSVGLAMVLVVTQIHVEKVQVQTVENQAAENQTAQKNVQEAFEIMASVDSSDADSSSSSSSSWQDSSL